MWPRRFPWPDIIALCSGDEHGCESWLTASPGVRYAQKPENTGFFSNMAGVLRVSGLPVDHPRAYSVSGEPAWDRIPGQTPQKWEDLGIIQDGMSRHNSGSHFR